MSGIRGNYCQFCDKRVIDCNCFVTTTPSPARSDKDAERAKFEHWMVHEAKFIVGSKDPYPAGIERDWWRVWQAATATKQQAERVLLDREDSAIESLAAKAQESAPSSESIVPQQGDIVTMSFTVKRGDKVYNVARSDHAFEGGESIDTPEFDALLDDYAANSSADDRWQSDKTNVERASSRAALVAHIDARRATAGNAAPTEADDSEGGASALRAEPAGQHDVSLAALAEEIEALSYVHGRENFGKRADFAHYCEGHEEARNEAAKLVLAFAAGAARQGGVTCNKLNSNSVDRQNSAKVSNNASSELASNTATAAPGDLPPLPKIYGGNYSVGELEFMLSEYGRACIASNAGAAPAEPKKELAHGHRDDFYLMASARRLASNYSVYQIRHTLNWVFASELFATGSNSARQICIDAGIDPDAKVIERAPSNSPAGAREQTK